MVRFEFFIRLRLRFLPALRLLAGRFLRSRYRRPGRPLIPRGIGPFTCVSPLFFWGVRACLRLNTPELDRRSRQQCRDTPRRQPCASELCSPTRPSAPYTALFRPPPPLLHPLGSFLLYLSPSGKSRKKRVQAREGGTKGIQTRCPSDGANGCGCCAVVIRAIPVPSWIRGWFAPIAETPLAIPNALLFSVRAADISTFVAVGPRERGAGRRVVFA